MSSAQIAVKKPPRAGGFLAIGLADLKLYLVRGDVKQLVQFLLCPLNQPGLTFRGSHLSPALTEPVNEWNELTPGQRSNGTLYNLEIFIVCF